jgi:ComF family protein
MLTLFTYSFPIDHMVTQLKFHGKLVYAKLFGQLLTKKIIQHYSTNPLPTLIIPVPLHRKRLQERGFNQAFEISKPIGKMLKIKIDVSSCIRKKHTVAQSSLDAVERKKNIKNCFELIKPLTANHIAIIDDVVTTGETTREFSAMLKNHGVKKIDLWCCAHTLVQ